MKLNNYFLKCIFYDKYANNHIEKQKEEQNRDSSPHFDEQTMEGDYKKEEGVALLVIVVLAALSLTSLLIAFAYYCYVSNKVSKHLKSLNGELMEK